MCRAVSVHTIHYILRGLKPTTTAIKGYYSSCVGWSDLINPLRLFKLLNLWKYKVVPSLADAGIQSGLCLDVGAILKKRHCSLTDVSYWMMHMCCVVVEGVWKRSTQVKRMI